MNKQSMNYRIYTGLSQRLQAHPLETRIIKISTETSPIRAIQPDLEDDQKRWLIVGICLHSVIAPALRTYIPPFLTALYNKLKQSHQIHQQTYPNQLKRYRPTNKELSYEAINNNATVKVRGKKDEPSYDYNVTNTVDLSKLFLQTHMTQYTGFDDTCDSSALLGIIINLDVFPPLVKNAAETVRKDVRNAWAHCNFTEWDVHKYQSSFQELYKLIRSLGLSHQKEVEILGKLTHWEINGIHLLQGTTVGLELVQELKKETGDIARYLRDVVSHTDDSLKEVLAAICDIDNSLDKLIKDFWTLSSTCDQLKTDMKTVHKDVDTLNKTAHDLSQRQQEHEVEIINLKQGVQEIEIKSTEAKVEVETIRNDLNDTKTIVDKNRADIDALSKYVLHSRPDDKIFFYPPNRNRSFMCRDDEIDEVMQKFITKGSEHALQVICGLGGTGKTSLAIEFAWRFQNYYPGGVFWMSAESNEVLEDSFQRLSIDIDTVGRDAKETMYKTLKWLSSIQNRWLLVVDNVDMEEIRGSIRELIMGSWKRQSIGHILITSRRETSLAEEEFDICASDCLTLKTFSDHESIIFMQARIGNQPETNNESLDELLKELGGLPLALEQAAAHIKQLKCSFKAYLEKFKQRRLKMLTEIKPSYEMSKERQTVRTTWQLNFDYIEKQSEDIEIGSAAKVVMNVMAFLLPDDIPLELINVGSPEVCLEDLQNTLQNELGSNQILEILTRFSLFHWSDRNAVSVHRLVQEVIRDSIKSSDELQNILLCATRMLNYALEHQPSPNDAMKVENLGRTSLKMWHRLCYHATSLKTHLFDFMSKKDQKTVYFNLETAKLLQATSLYHSLVQRQDQALKDQDQMLTILAAIGVSDSDFRNLTAIKIPLMKQERLVIQGSMNHLITPDQMNAESENHASETTLKSLKQRGNDAFNSSQYLSAIQYYTEAVVRSEVVDPKLLSNRSLSYLKSGDYESALHDADRCIEADPNFWKGYCWKSYAIAQLVRSGHLPPSWESAGLAAAAVAGHLNGQCLLEYRMKIEYPIVVFKVIEEQQNLGTEIASLSNHKYATLLLRSGRYIINTKRGEVTTKSVQIIGIEDSVEIICQDVVHLIRPDSSTFRFHVRYTVEPQIDVYFENVIFPKETGQIFVGKNVNATFYRCKFSNGKRGCEDFPYCQGGKGCVNVDPNICKSKSDRNEKINTSEHVGVAGYSGICVGDKTMPGGKSFIQNCLFDRCGGAGILCEGEGSVIAIKDSICKNMIQMGAEARYGGTIIAENCSFIDNQTHGIAIGPLGHGQFTNCRIQGNRQEGFWCGKLSGFDFKVMESNEREQLGGSTCTIRDNIICQNGMCGISLEGGSYDITGNKIFENWIWAIMAQSCSSTNIINNDIFENKCGGIRVGLNYSASVHCDGNSIRDHTGPGMHVEDVPENMLTSLQHITMSAALRPGGLPIRPIYSQLPIVTNRNMFSNNNRGFQHPKQLAEILQTCCSCHRKWNSLKTCAKCKKATYCSKDCQSVHWKRHKHICKMLQETFSITIDMSKTMSQNEFVGEGFMNIFMSHMPQPHSGTPPKRSSSKQFIVKIQSGLEYKPYDPNKLMSLYDETRSLEFWFRNPKIYHIVTECGILCASQLSTKKIYCWASFRSGGRILCLHTENLAPVQTW